MIDAEILNNLTDEQKARLMELEKTFNTDGWKVIKAFMAAKSQDAAQRMVYAQDWDSFVELRGMGRAYEAFANFEDETYNEFMARAQEAAPDIEEVVID